MPIRRALLVVLGAIALAPASGTLGAQAAARTGRIVGRIIDVTTGQGISDVGLQVVGTTTGTVSGIDGRYTLPRVNAGSVTVQARRLGYTPKSITGLVVEAGKTLEQNIVLDAATVKLAASVVTAQSERGSVSEALDKQRTATAIVSSVTTEQIAKSPDGDAAQAVQRVSGVTVQGGKFVFVRGLGERYTTTQLNGTRVPSPEPEKRTVPLDLFPTGLLEQITTSKTFTPDQQGDFSGAQLEIKTREFPAIRQLSMQTTGGYNPGSTGTRMLSAFTAGGERFANVGSKRDVPALVASLGNFQGINLNPSDYSRLVNTFRNAWEPSLKTATPNTSTSISLGGNDPVFGQRIGYLLSGTYAFSQDVKTDQVRALAARGTTAGSTIEQDRFQGETGSAGVLWGGLANFSTLIGGHTRLMLNNTYSRTADNDARREYGQFENEGFRARIDRNQYVERAIRSSQLAAEHQLGTRQRLDWAVTSSGVRRDEPDRTEFVYVIEQDTPGGPEHLRWLNNGNAGAVRTFSKLTESNREGRANYQLNFDASGRQHYLKVGGLYRTTDRDADTRAYSISAPFADAATRELPPEALFDGRFSTPTSDFFRLSPLSQGGSYGARDALAAAYIMGEWALSNTVRLVGGARYEHDQLRVNAASTLGQPIQTRNDWSDILPSLALNLAPNDHQNIRISLSQTLARPEYRELVPIKSRDVLNGDDLEGNADLQRTRIQNADLRWEFYPQSDEVISFGVFVKEFDQPIERVYHAAGATSRFVGYVNAQSASNYGVEMELRRNLGFLGRPLRPFSGFTNITLMQSTIDLGDNKSSATNPTRRMVGQAPYVVNLGLSYATRTGHTSATVLFNRVGERIDAAGDLPLPDVITLPRNVVDFSLRFPLGRGFSGRFDAKNLMDDAYTTKQGTVIRESYKTGRVMQLGLIYKP
ncbi:MAG: TonB-dependent receptor plug domain-containing protein [Gemmatimonadaceae bacterium]